MSYNPDSDSISGASDAALSNPTDNQLLSYKEDIAKWVNQTPTIEVVAGLPAALSGKADTSHTHSVADIPDLQATVDDKLDRKNSTVELPNPTNDSFARVNIAEDGSNTHDWPDRLAFYFDGTRAGYFNEYGELRARPAKRSTVGFRAMSRADAADDADFFQVSRTSNTDAVLAVSKKYITTKDASIRHYYATDPGGYLERIELNYPINTVSSEVRQVWISGFKASWHNEWGALRGTSPLEGGYGDALVRAIRTDQDSIANGNALEIVDRRGGGPNNIMWGRKWTNGDLVRNGHTMNDVYVMPHGGTPPSTLPAGTVIIELDA